MVKEETDSEPVDDIPLSARAKLFEWTRLVLVAAKDDVIASHSLSSRYKHDPFNFTAHFKLTLSHGCFCCPVTSEPKFE